MRIRQIGMGLAGMLLLALGPACPGPEAALKPGPAPAAARKVSPVADQPALNPREESPVSVEHIGPVARARLENGLTLLVKKRRSGGLVAIQAWVAAGSAHEGPDEHGAAHLLEHMLFKGGSRHPPGELARMVEAAGGEINAWTSFEHTVYHLVLPAERLAVGLHLLADAVFRPSLPEEELARERQVVLEEISRSRDLPERHASDLLFSLAFSGHPYGHDILGSSASLARLDRQHLAAFHRRRYRPGNVVLAVAGDVAPEVVLRQLRRELAGLPGAAGGRRKPAAGPAGPGRLQVRLVEDDISEAHFQLGWRLPGLAHRDLPALELAAMLLGQGESSRLVSRLKLHRQLVNDVYAYLHSEPRAGLLVVAGSGRGERLEQAIEELVREVARLAATPPPASELAKVQALAEAEVLYSQETVEGEARRLAAFQANFGSPAAAAEHLEQLLKCRPEAVSRAAARYLRPENLSAVFLVPRRTRLSRARLRSLLGQLPTATTRPPAAPALVRRRLRQGPVVLVEPDPESAVVSIQASMLGGVRFENEDNNGIFNLLAALLGRSTADRDAASLASQVDALGGSLEGFSGRNTIGLRADFPARHADTALELVCQCLSRPGFTAEQVRRERRLVLEAIRNRRDDPAGLAFDLFAATLYRKHPYRLPLLGTRQSVVRLDARRLSEFWRSFYRPRRLVLAVVGPVDPDHVTDLVRRHCRPPAPGTVEEFRPPPLPLEPAPRKPRRARLHLRRQQVHLVLGYPGTRVRAADRHAVEVLVAVLAGQGGRLFSELRDRKALAYALSAFSLEGMEPGYLAFYLATAPERREQALAALRAELRRLGSAPPGAEEIARAQRYLVGTHLVARQRASTRAQELALAELFGTSEDWQHYAERIMAVQPAQVAAAARRYLRPEREVLVEVGP